MRTPSPRRLLTLAVAAVLGLTSALPVASAAAQEQADVHPLITFSIEHAQQLYPPAQPTFAHGGAPPFVVLSRLDVFADSLAAASLLADQPLLFTDGDVVEPVVVDELDRLMPDGGIVQVLGGPAAIDDAVLDQLTEAGHDPRRVAGATRVETSLAIADLAVQLHGPRTRVALARATGPEPTAEWADAIAATTWSAIYGNPILLTTGDALHPAVAEWMAEHEVDSTVLLGGEAALSAAVEQAVPAPERHAGPNRYATAVAISVDLFPFSRYHFRIIAADHPDGWGYALAGAGMAVEDRAPVLLVATDALPQETADRTCSTGDRAQVTVLGGTDVVGEDVRDQLVADCPPAPEGQ